MGRPNFHFTVGDLPPSYRFSIFVEILYIKKLVLTKKNLYR